MLWVSFELGTAVLLALLPGLRREQLWALLICGGLVGQLSTYYPRMVIFFGVVRVFDADFPELALATNNPMKVVDLLSLIDIFILPISLWVVTNYFFIHFLGFCRFGIAREKQDREGSESSLSTALGTGRRILPLPVTSRDWPPILKQIEGYSGQAIVCLASEGNYVRVHSREDVWLIRYTFQKAVSEFDCVDGLRVHRSYWIYLAALVAVQRAGRGYCAKLDGGLIVPFSRANTQLAQDLEQELNSKRSEVDWQATP